MQGRADVLGGARMFERMRVAQKRLHETVGGAPTSARESGQFREARTPIFVRGRDATVEGLGGNRLVEHRMGLRTVLGRDDRPVIRAVCAATVAQVCGRSIEGGSTGRSARGRPAHQQLRMTPSHGGCRPNSQEHGG